MMKRLVVLPLLLALMTPLVFAQTTPSSDDETDNAVDIFDADTEKTELGWDRLSVSLGYVRLTANGKFGLSFPSGEFVPVIDLDRLGLDDEDGSHWFTLHWRSRSSRWGAWFGTWQYDSAGYRIWEEELEYDGVVIPVGAGVATEMNADWYIMEGTYSFVRTDKLDIGVGAGIHAVDLKTTLKGRVQAGDQSSELINEELDSLAPLPNVLGYAYWKFADRWRLTARYGWFGLTYDDYDGQMTNLHALLRFDLSPRWAIEGGYQFVKLDLGIDEGNYTSVYDIDFKGPMAILRFNF